MTDLVPVKEVDQALATVLGVPPKQMMTYAIEIADTLTSVLRARGMTQKFGGSQQEHVKSEGWQLAGSLMGFTASEGPATELADGSYEAIMELRSASTGKVLAVASARCGADEPNWRGKPKFARRSMAYTRALGRVYCQNFRWLIHLAGFSGTPAEELDGLSDEVKAEIYMNTPDQQRRLVGYLEKTKIDEVLWEKIGEHLKGKENTRENLNNAIDMALADVSKI